MCCTGWRSDTRQLDSAAAYCKCIYIYSKCMGHAAAYCKCIDEPLLGGGRLTLPGLWVIVTLSWGCSTPSTTTSTSACIKHQPTSNSACIKHQATSTSACIKHQAPTNACIKHQATSNQTPSTCIKHPKCSTAQHCAVAHGYIGSQDRAHHAPADEYLQHWMRLHCQWISSSCSVRWWSMNKQ